MMKTEFYQIRSRRGSPQPVNFYLTELYGVSSHMTFETHGVQTIEKRYRLMSDLVLPIQPHQLNSEDDAERIEEDNEWTAADRP